MIRPRLSGPVRSRLVDLGLVAASALAALVIAGEAEESGRLAGDALVAALGLAVLGAVALWWRRRFPVAVAVLLTLVLAGTDLAVVAVLVAVWTVSAHRSWSVAATTVGVGLLVYVPYSVVRPAPDLSAFGVNVLYLALILVALVAGSTARIRREAIGVLRERVERAETEANERAERLRVQERHRIAGEMHDVLAHRISLVSLQASALEVRTDLPAEVTGAVAAIWQQSHDALEDLRGILDVLRAGGDGAGLRPQPGLADLDRLFAENRSVGAVVHVDRRITGEPSDVIGRTVYRLVQEGLTNARKHASGAPVDVLVDRAGTGELWVRLCNPLVSVPGTGVPGSHSGLLGLAERVELAGGRLSYGVQRVPEGGVVFQLEAWLPWPT